LEIDGGLAGNKKQKGKKVQEIYKLQNYITEKWKLSEMLLLRNQNPPNMKFKRPLPHLQVLPIF